MNDDQPTSAVAVTRPKGGPAPKVPEVVPDLFPDRTSQFVRAKRKHVTEKLRHKIEVEGRSESMAEAMIRQVEKGNVGAFESVMNRVEGPVMQRLAITPLEYESLSNEELTLELARLSRYDR